MAAMVRRNLLVFFRDRAAVFFSLLAVLIIIALYAVFLGDTMTSGLDGVEGIGFLMDSWVIAGILAVVSMTSTLGALGVLIDDKVKKVGRDFAVSPLGRGSIAGSYVFSAYAVGVIMSLAALVVGEVYIVASGGELLSAEALAKVVGCILLSVLSSSAIMFFIASLIKTQGAFGAISTIIGTLIGFLTGMYIPIGSLPEGVQSVMRVFPVSYSASAFRQVMMEQPIAASFEGAPQAMVDEFKLEMGVVFGFDGGETTMATAVVVMLVTAVVFYGLGLLVSSRKRR